MIKKQFTLYLENRPGTLARIMRELADANVNIDGISVSTSTDVGLVQVVVSNAARAKRIMTRLGVPFTSQEVALLPLENVPGALCRVVSNLARDEVNVNYAYATGSPVRKGGQAYVVIGAPDLAAVEKAWSESPGR